MLEADTLSALGEPCADAFVPLAAEARPNSREWDSPWEGFVLDSGRDRIRASVGCASRPKSSRDLS